MLKSTVEFRVGGRRVSAKDFTKRLGDEVRRLSRNRVEQAVRRVRCPIHGTPARIRFTGSTGGQLKWSVEGCCQDLVKRVHSSLGGKT